jgi:hypothetical protein
MFGQKESKETSGAYSPRSQRNWLAQRKLEQERKSCEGLIHYCERAVGELEKSKEAQLKAQIERQGGSGQFFGRTLTDLAEKNAELATYKERRTLIQSQIEALASPSPQQAAERAERQNSLAKLAAERLQKDRLVGGALKALRGLLEERAELTAKMLIGAEAADLTIDDGRLDAQRFEELLASLPEEVTATSKGWHAWFIGDQEGMKSYAVVATELRVVESLARANSYAFGDKVELTDEEARDLRREVCPIGRARYDLPWSFEPARIVPLEVFEALVREATDKGSTAQNLVSLRNAEAEERLKARYVPEYQEAVREHHKAMRAQGLLIGGAPDND